MQIKLYTGRSQVILMILILSPYPFLNNVIFRHELVHEFVRELVDEFKYEIRTNLYEFLCTKNWLLQIISQLNCQLDNG